MSVRGLRTHPTRTITEQQRERMEANRQKALVLCLGFGEYAPVIEVAKGGKVWAECNDWMPVSNWRLEQAPP